MINQVVLAFIFGHIAGLATFIVFFRYVLKAKYITVKRLEELKKNGA